MNSSALASLLLIGLSALHAEIPARPTYLRLQVLLDRAHFSPGEIDGVAGENTRTALRVFRAVHRLRETADFAPQTLRALEGKEPVPTLVPYTVTEEDVRGPFVTIPNEMMDQANLPALGYQSALEALSEKFHINPMLLTRLNPGKDVSTAGVEIQVPNISDQPPPKAAKIVVSKSKL